MPIPGMQNEKNKANLVELTSRAHSRWSCRSIADATPSVAWISMFHSPMLWHIVQWSGLMSLTLRPLPNILLGQRNKPPRAQSSHRQIGSWYTVGFLSRKRIGAQFNTHIAREWVFSTNILSSTLTRPQNSKTLIAPSKYIRWRFTALVGVASFGFTAAQARKWVISRKYACLTLWQRPLQT